MTVVWNGALDASLLADDVVSAGHRLADAAKVGDWKTVFEMLDDPTERVDVNSWRPGGSAWFTVLHQAAWHGAPTEVVGRLIRRGALRSQTDSRGRTPRAVRRDRQREMSLAKGAAVQNWEPPVLPAGVLRAPPSPLSSKDAGLLNGHLADVIDSRIRGVLFGGRDPRRVLRYPPVEILHG
jgi:Ankyrin repeats (many copies)